jgi:hypothetical protein
VTLINPIFFAIVCGKNTAVYLKMVLTTTVNMKVLLALMKAQLTLRIALTSHQTVHGCEEPVVQQSITCHFLLNKKKLFRHPRPQSIAMLSCSDTPCTSLHSEEI